LVGPYEEKLDPLRLETLNEISQNNNIITVGFQADVRPYFAISNVLVFPSYREGFPNVVLQAGAMGLPSIVTNINGCNEIIIEKKNGWIIPVKDQDAVLNAMRNCIIDRKNLIKEKPIIRNIIENRFHQEIVWQALLKEYKLLEKYL
jgi:glycosyltransferase involved in cell wall biosynthesis